VLHLMLLCHTCDFSHVSISFYSECIYSHDQQLPYCVPLWTLASLCEGSAAVGDRRLGQQFCLWIHPDKTERTTPSNESHDLAFILENAPCSEIAATENEVFRYETLKTSEGDHCEDGKPPN
jgi:hypothetical protein